MNKRLVAIVAAAVLAVAGVVSLVSYANQADERAFDGAKLTKVLQVTAPVPAGTAATQVASRTKVVSLPSAAVPAGALDTLDSVGGKVTSVALEPGELVLDGRFVKQGEKATAAAGGLPAGMQTVSVPLSGPRAVDEALNRGDIVWVYGSFEGTGDKPSATRLLKSKVTVTKVSTSAAASDGAASVVVTLAVDTHVAERIIHTLEFGKVWLGKGNGQSSDDGAKSTTRKDIVP
jgi:pilus assembly protein CpaB